MVRVGLAASKMHINHIYEQPTDYIILCNNKRTSPNEIEHPYLQNENLDNYAINNIYDQLTDCKISLF